MDFFSIKICLLNHRKFVKMQEGSSEEAKKEGIPEFLGSGRKRWTLDAGLWMLDAGCWTLDSACWTPDAGLWMLNSGRWTLDVGRWILHFVRWALGTGHYL